MSLYPQAPLVSTLVNTLVQKFRVESKPIHEKWLEQNSMKIKILSGIEVYDF